MARNRNSEIPSVSEAKAKLTYVSEPADTAGFASEIFNKRETAVSTSDASSLSNAPPRTDSFSDIHQQATPSAGLDHVAGMSAGAGTKSLSAENQNLSAARAEQTGAVPESQSRGTISADTGVVNGGERSQTGVGYGAYGSGRSYVGSDGNLQVTNLSSRDTVNSVSLSNLAQASGSAERSRRENAFAGNAGETSNNNIINNSSIAPGPQRSADVASVTPNRVGTTGDAKATSIGQSDRSIIGQPGGIPDSKSFSVGSNLGSPNAGAVDGKDMPTGTPAVQRAGAVDAKGSGSDANTNTAATNRSGFGPAETTAGTAGQRSAAAVAGKDMPTGAVGQRTAGTDGKDMTAGTSGGQRAASGAVDGKDIPTGSAGRRTAAGVVDGKDITAGSVAQRTAVGTDGKDMPTGASAVQRTGDANQASSQGTKLDGGRSDANQASSQGAKLDSGRSDANQTSSQGAKLDGGRSDANQANWQGAKLDSGRSDANQANWQGGKLDSGRSDANQANWHGPKLDTGRSDTNQAQWNAGKQDGIKPDGIKVDAGGAKANTSPDGRIGIRSDGGGSGGVPIVLPGIPDILGGMKGLVGRNDGGKGDGADTKIGVKGDASANGGDGKGSVGGKTGGKDTFVSDGGKSITDRGVEHGVDGARGVKDPVDGKTSTAGAKDSVDGKSSTAGSKDSDGRIGAAGGAKDSDGRSGVGAVRGGKDSDGRSDIGTTGGGKNNAVADSKGGGLGSTGDRIGRSGKDNLVADGRTGGLGSGSDGKVGGRGEVPVIVPGSLPVPDIAAGLRNLGQRLGLDGKGKSDDSSNGAKSGGIADGSRGSGESQIDEKGPNSSGKVPVPFITGQNGPEITTRIDGKTSKNPDGIDASSRGGRNDGKTPGAPYSQGGTDIITRTGKDAPSTRGAKDNAADKQPGRGQDADGPRIVTGSSKDGKAAQGDGPHTVVTGSGKDGKATQGDGPHTVVTSSGKDGKATQSDGKTHGAPFVTGQGGTDIITRTGKDAPSTRGARDDAGNSQAGRGQGVDGPRTIVTNSTKDGKVTQTDGPRTVATNSTKDGKATQSDGPRTVVTGSAGVKDGPHTVVSGSAGAKDTDGPRTVVTGSGKDSLAHGDKGNIVSGAPLDAVAIKFLAGNLKAIAERIFPGSKTDATSRIETKSTNYDALPGRPTVRLDSLTSKQPEGMQAIAIERSVGPITQFTAKNIKDARASEPKADGVTLGKTSAASEISRSLTSEQPKVGLSAVEKSLHNEDGVTRSALKQDKSPLGSPRADRRQARQSEPVASHVFAGESHANETEHPFSEKDALLADFAIILEKTADGEVLESDMVSPMTLQEEAFERRSAEQADDDEVQFDAPAAQDQFASRYEYVVEPGDTVERVAIKTLNDVSLAPLIYQINRDIIPIEMRGGQMTFVLKPGIVIWLPFPREIESFRQN